MTRTQAEWMGCHIAARVVWVAAIDSNGRLTASDVDRVGLPAGIVSEHRALAEACESLAAAFGRQQVGSVALLDAGKSSRKPAPSVSRQRGQLEGAVMIAAHTAHAELVRVSHDQIEKRFGLRPSDGDFPGLMAEFTGGTGPSRWNDRSKAFGAVMVAREMSP